jgi:hypothetical protein
MNLRKFSGSALLEEVLTNGPGRYVIGSSKDLNPPCSQWYIGKVAAYRNPGMCVLFLVV